MTKTNNPLFSNSYHVVYDRVQKKCNINQKEFFSGKFFVDKHLQASILMTNRKGPG